MVIEAYDLLLVVITFLLLISLVHHSTSKYITVTLIHATSSTENSDKTRMKRYQNVLKWYTVDLISMGLDPPRFDGSTASSQTQPLRQHWYRTQLISPWQ